MILKRRSSWKLGPLSSRVFGKSINNEVYGTGGCAHVFGSSCNLISNTRAMNICMAACGNTIACLLVTGEKPQDYETIDYAGEGPNAYSVKPSEYEVLNNSISSVHQSGCELVIQA